MAKHTITLLACICMYLLFPITTQAQDYTETAISFVPPHEYQSRSKCDTHTKDPLNSSNCYVRLNAVNYRLEMGKGGYIVTDTADDGSLGLTIKLDFRNDSFLLPFRELVYFPTIKDRDRKRRREQHKYLETAWSVSKYVFNDILHGESPYQFIGLYMVSPLSGRVFFVHSTQIDDEIEVRDYEWKKQTFPLEMLPATIRR